MVVKALKKKVGEKGQALFEFIVFLPFLLFILTIMFMVGNAINGSINQQKAVRRYFFHYFKGNSTIPSNEDLTALFSGGVRRMGAVSVGWREKSVGDFSFATCYPFAGLFGDDEDCFRPSLQEGRSNYIRIYTTFGLCGETYIQSDEGPFSPDYFRRAYASGCMIQ